MLLSGLKGKKYDMPTKFLSKGQMTEPKSGGSGFHAEALESERLPGKTNGGTRHSPWAWGTLVLLWWESSQSFYQKWTPWSLFDPSLPGLTWEHPGWLPPSWWRRGRTFSQQMGFFSDWMSKSRKATWGLLWWMGAAAMLEFSLLTPISQT